MVQLNVKSSDAILLPEEEITSDDLLTQLGITVEKRSPLVYSRVMGTMTALGFVAARVGAGNNRRRGYKRVHKEPTGKQEEIVAW